MQTIILRWRLCLTILLILLGNISTSFAHQSTEDKLEIIIPKLKIVAKEGQLNGLQIEYWVGGGQPPPYYRSERFRLYSKGEKVQMEFDVLKFHPKLMPNEVIEKYSHSGASEDVRNIARMLLDLRVFEIHFPEEKDPSIGDVISHEIAVNVGNAEIKRTYYRSMPIDLAPLDKIIHQLIGITKQKGLHSWLHKGRTIENPFANEDH